MGVNDWSQAERDLYAVGSRALLDDLERRAADHRRAFNETYGLDTTSAAEVNREYAERMRKLEEDHKAWLAGHLASIYGEADEPAPTPNVGQGQTVAPATGPAPAPGSGPGQPNPYAAELAEAERIRALTMQAFADERERLIRPNQGPFQEA